MGQERNDNHHILDIELLWNRYTLEVVGIRLHMKRHVLKYYDSLRHFGPYPDITVSQILMPFLRIMKRIPLSGIRDQGTRNPCRKATENQEFWRIFLERWC